MTEGDGSSARQGPPATLARGNPGGMTASTQSGREILARLVELTPEPPAGLEVEQLLAAFEAIVEARAAIIATLAPPLQLAATDRPMLAELERRQMRWLDALAAAQRTIGQQRCGAEQLRAYARTV